MSPSAAAGPVLFEKRSYFPELDGMRALCVLLVISVHLYDSGRYWTWLAGARGVTVFFVLSGFLITTLAGREEEARGRLSLAAFYVRRSCRIFPLYYLTLGLYAGLLFLTAAGAHLRALFADALPYYLLYLQEVPFYAWLVLAQRDLPFFHSWSLGVEEKFYLLWPLTAFVLWRGDNGRRLRGTLALLAALALAGTALPLLDARLKVVGRAVLCYYPILAGCLLALLLRDPAWLARLRWLGSGLGTAAALVLFLACHFATPWAVGGGAAALELLYPAATALLLAGVVLGEGPLQRLLRRPLLVGLGRLSYGVYLVHVLCLVAAYRLLPASATGLAGSVLAFALTAALSALVAWLLAVTVERPLIEFGRRWSRRLLEGPAVPSAQTLPPRPAAA
jgi:peptidoglycan/LPS O-acetylase OafA/YrhL